MSLLSLQGVEASYGASQALFGVDLTIEQGQVVALMGRNGMGKTTTIRAIFGLTPPGAGRIAFAGQDLVGRPPHRIARLGLGLVPEGRRCFPNLTVRETCWQRRVPAAGRSRRSARFFRASPSVMPSRPARSRAANSRCWRSAAPS